tara:strand:+ start:898 stop:1035 length:138 start_codon:yes stop_codon:yes gene_type:complete
MHIGHFQWDEEENKLYFYQGNGAATVGDVQDLLFVLFNLEEHLDH